MSLLREDGRCRYRANDLVVLLAERKGRDIDSAVWDLIIEGSTRSDASALAVVAVRRENLPRAEALLSKAQPDDPVAANIRGVLASRAGNEQEAVRQFRLAQDGGLIVASSNLGASLLALGDVDGAVDAYETAERAGDPNAALRAGAALYKGGRQNDAAAAFERAELAGNEQGAMGAAGALYASAGSIRAAVAAFARAEGSSGTRRRHSLPGDANAHPGRRRGA